jgi:glutathione S-transferase
MLCELELPYETREIITRTDTMDDPDFRALTQRGKIPFLQDGDIAIGESAAMVLYLADRYRDRVALAPAPGSAARARFDELCFFIMVELDAVLYVLRRHEGLPEIYGESRVACEAARQYFLRQVGDIEASLLKGQKHLLPDAFSGADILLVSCLEWARFVNIPLSERLSAYRETIIQRPAYARAMNANFPAAAVAALQGAP